MVLIQVLGGLLVVAGLILFTYDQVKDKKGESTVSAWKLNVSGPPPLVLIVFGSLVFLFPFSPFWSDVEEPPPPSTIPEAVVTTTSTTLGQTSLGSSTTTTFEGTTTTFDFGNIGTFGTLLDPGQLKVAPVDVPAVPSGYDLYFHETCGADVLEWFQDDLGNTSGWVVIVEKYDPVNDFLIETYEIDTLSDFTVYGNTSAICYWDFIDPNWNFESFGNGYYYYLWVYAYNSVGYSNDALWMEYYDF